MDHMSEHPQAAYSFKDFLPLIIIAAAIIMLTALHQWYYGFDGMTAMRIFYGLFLFGLRLF